RQSKRAGLVGKRARRLGARRVERADEGAWQRLSGLIDDDAGQRLRSERWRGNMEHEQENQCQIAAGDSLPPEAGRAHQDPPGVSRAEKRTPPMARCPDLRISARSPSS